ncbi:DUF4258 domain-containing protein [bacterium]|nr:DUF4258 domain-containing protein [bacterium]
MLIAGLKGTVSMESKGNILAEVRLAAAKKILFLPHALRQMLRPDRMISRMEVRRAIDQGEVIEDYPKDVRGHSCLILVQGEQERAIHVVCAPKEDYLAIITAYIPDPNEWNPGFKERSRK